MANQLPGTSVERGVEGERGPPPRDAEPDLATVYGEGVAVVGDLARHDRDDHRRPLGRALEAELGPERLTRVESENPASYVAAKSTATHAPST
jgi:hypothetical protein